MRRWEYWELPDGTEKTLIPDNRPEAREEVVAEGFVFRGWSTIARGYNDAMRAWHDHLGWGEYKPMLRDDGTPYPEDEDDAFAGPGHI
jgi:hypothetical protein